jgi:hypothetical protein
MFEWISSLFGGGNLSPPADSSTNYYVDMELDFIFQKDEIPKIKLYRQRDYTQIYDKEMNSIVVCDEQFTYDVLVDLMLPIILDQQYVQNNFGSKANFERCKADLLYKSMFAIAVANNLNISSSRTQPAFSVNFSMPVAEKLKDAGFDVHNCSKNSSSITEQARYMEAEARKHNGWQ